MKKFINALSIVAVVVFSSLAANAATCNGPTNYQNQSNQVTINYGICGYVTKLSSISPYYSGPTHSYHVSVCLADSMGNPPASADTCGSPGSTGYDGPNNDYDVFFIGPMWGSNGPFNKLYYIFVWDDADIYGSKTIPAYYFTGPSDANSAYYGIEFNSVQVPPRPLPSSAVNPANGAQNVSSNFTLKWTNGADAVRTNWASNYVYDIFGHGMGASDVPVAQNIPCNPDASGNCTFAITNLKTSAYYFWHVVGKWSSPSYLGRYAGNTGADQNFTTHADPNVAVSFMTNNYQNYLGAENCGGGAMIATATSPGSCESFYVVDSTSHTGGGIYDGDIVALQQAAGTSGYWVTAYGGGGSVMFVNGTSNGAWQQFTIHKLSSQFSTPGTQILDNDRFSLTTAAGNGAYYVSADNGGGGYVWALSTTFSDLQSTFVYGVH